MSNGQQDSKAELVAIYRLEFYRRQSDWKLGRKTRKGKPKKTADAADKEDSPQPQSNPLNQTYCVEASGERDNHGRYQNIPHQNEKESAKQTDLPKKPKDNSQTNQKLKKNRRKVKKQNDIDTTDKDSSTRKYDTVYYRNSQMQRNEYNPNLKDLKESKITSKSNVKVEEIKVSKVGIENQANAQDFPKHNVDDISTNKEPENNQEMSEAKSFLENDQYTYEVRVQKVMAQPHLYEELTKDDKNYEQKDFRAPQELGPGSQYIGQEYQEFDSKNFQSDRTQDPKTVGWEVPETIHDPKIGRPRLTNTSSVDYTMESQQMECEEQDSIKVFQKVPEIPKNFNGRPHLTCKYSVDYTTEEQYVDQNMEIERQEYEMNIHEENNSSKGNRDIKQTVRERLYNAYKVHEMWRLEIISEEHCYANSPKAYTNSPEAYPNSPEIYGNSPDAYPNSPEMYGNSPDVYPNSPEMYRNSPEENRNSPKEYINSPEVDLNFPVAYYLQESDNNSPVVNPNLPDVDPNMPNLDQNLPNLDQNLPNLDQNLPHLNPNLPELDQNGYEGGEARCAREKEVWTDQGRAEHIWSEDVLLELRPELHRPAAPAPPSTPRTAPRISRRGCGVGGETEWVEPDRLLEWLLTKEPAYQKAPPMDVDTSSDSFIQFMRGAHCNPHSTEIELELEDSFTVLHPAITLTSTGLVAKGRHHANALRALADEIKAREQITGDKLDVHTLAITMEPHHEQSSSYEEFPVRDIGLLPDCFLAGSHRNHPDRNQLDQLNHPSTAINQPNLDYNNLIQYSNKSDQPVHRSHPLDHPNTSTNHPNLAYNNLFESANKSDQPIHPNVSDKDIYPGIKTSQLVNVSNYQNNLIQCQLINPNKSDQPIHPNQSNCAGIKTNQPINVINYTNNLYYSNNPIQCLPIHPNKPDQSIHPNQSYKPIKTNQPTINFPNPVDYPECQNHPYLCEHLDQNNNPRKITNLNHRITATSHSCTIEELGWNHSKGGDCNGNFAFTTNRNHPVTATNHSVTATNNPKSTCTIKNSKRNVALASIAVTHHAVTATNHQVTATNHCFTATNHPVTAINHPITTTNNTNPICTKKDCNHINGGDSNGNMSLFNELDAISDVEMCGPIGRGRGRLHTDNRLGIGRGRGRIGT